MGDLSTDAGQNARARFACDHCRTKKLKCSRELPKCSACKPWPSSCDYTSDTCAVGKRKRPTSDAERPPPGQVENETTTPIKTASSRQDKRVRRENDPTQSYSSFSFLNDAATDLSANAGLSASTAHKNAHAELAHLQHSLSMGAEDTNMKSAGTAYHIPTRSAGYAYISKFLAAAELGRLFFQEPTDECLRRVIFDPANVRQKAWVVYVNYMLLAMVSPEAEPSDESKRLRSNVHLALNDADIFLCPSIVNVQTLATLAIHGEDFATPSQSWMLVGHACRQAEALALHQPARTDDDNEQKRLALFWMLFVIDKGCSLAFGRTPSLPTSVYGNVPSPNYQYLARNCPHLGEVLSGRVEKPSDGSHFGALFFTKGFELTKLVGSVLEANGLKRSVSDRDRMRAQIEEWFRSTDAELSAAMAAESDSTSAGQQREMALGIRSFKFQYLHILIVLLRGDTNRSALRIASAREALSILPDMVSNWGSVYNGITWQLLYLPFGPFFVIFGNVLSDPGAWTADQDLQLLRTTITYFESMRSQLSLLSTLSSRLAHTATVFVQLAQHHVDAASAHISATQPQDLLGDLDLAAIESYLEWLPADTVDSLTLVRPTGQLITAVEERSAPKIRTGLEGHANDVFDWFSWDTYYSESHH